MAKKSYVKADEIQVKGNQIFSPVRQKWLPLTPEERVRQEYLFVLTEEYGYTIDQFSEEMDVAGRGSAQARADFVIWRSAQDKTDQKSPFIIRPIASLFDLPRSDKSKIKTEILFIERCLDLLKPGGRMGIVLPEGVYNNPSLAYVRQFVEDRAYIKAVVSLPQETFISSGASVKASLLFLERYSDEEKERFDRTYSDAKAEIDAKYAHEIVTETQRIENAIVKAKANKNAGGRKSLQKELKDYIKQMKEKKASESRQLLKERFDYPNSFHDIEWHWPSSVMAPIGSVLSPRKEKVDRSTNDFSDLMPVTIHFDGSIEPRRINEDKEYSMDLFWVRPGDIVASKIDLKNGAVAIIPSDWDKAVVTNHFAVYEPNLERLDQKYFHLLIQAKFFKQHLWRNKVGAEGRKEVKLKFFESLEIPIPPLHVQQKIAAHRDAAEISIRESEILYENTKKESFDSFRRALGLSTRTYSDKPCLFIAKWSQTDRWGFDLVWRNKSDFDSFTYPIKPLKEVCKTGSGGTPNRKHQEYFGGTIPWVKTTEVRDNIINDTEEKITPLGLAASSAKVYPAGSIVVAMYGQGATRGRTAKLGIEASTNQACLVITEIIELLDSDFLWYYLMVSYEILRSLASGNNQPNLSAELIGNFPVPIPLKEIQNELKRLFEIAQIELSRLQSYKDEIQERTTKVLEQLILGLRSVEDIRNACYHKTY